MKTIRYIAYFVAAILLLYGFQVAFLSMKNLQKSIINTPASALAPRYMHKGDHIPATTFHPGEYFYTHVENKRTQECVGKINYRIVQKTITGDVTTTVILMNYQPTEISTPAGTFINDTLMQIPEWMPPGEYSLERTATWACTSDIHFVQSPIGKMIFTVEGQPTHDQAIIIPKG